MSTFNTSYSSLDGRYAKPADVDAKIASHAITEAQTFMRYVGTSTLPITNASTSRPSGSGPVYWMCAAGVTPTNAITGDLIWNAA